MYVRPYLEDPVLLQPVFDEAVLAHHFDNDKQSTNETPMYVRPYLEDPIFLQPDDGEVSLLHPDLSKAVSEKTSKPYVSHHDLITDPDLASNGIGSAPEPAWMVNFRKNLMRTKELTSKTTN